MNEQRRQAYLELINALLSCPKEQKLKILKANRELIDDGLAQTMKDVAKELAEKDKKSADWLVSLAPNLINIMSFYSIYDSSSYSSKYEVDDFLLDALLITEKNYDNPQFLYTFLKKNLDYLNYELINSLKSWTNSTLAEANREEALSIASTLGNFSRFISYFPLGNKAINLEIALAGYETIAKIFTKKVFAKQWAALQNNLGTIYYERIYGDRSENLEKAIIAYKAALEYFTQEMEIKEWVITLTNLGNVYCERIKGERTNNLEEAIFCYNTILQSRNHKILPQNQWAAIQNNLGTAYFDRILGDKAENIEKSIVVYKSALKVYTLHEFPHEWATTKNNLATAYRRRFRGNKNININLAIRNYKLSFKVYNKQDYPEYWARTQNNLGYVYSEIGKVNEAISCFQSALEIYTPKTFPGYCLQCGNNLGDAARTSERWAEAIKGYNIAIEAVEQSRTWAITDARRREILSDAIAVYANIVQACINNNQPDKAIEYVERSKARNLVELLATRDIHPKGNIPEIVFNDLKRLRREIVAEQRRLDIVEQNHSGGMISGNGESVLDSAAWLKNRDHLNQLLQQLDNLIATQIDPIDPNFKATQQVKPISYTEIQNLVDDRAAIVEWYITDDSFHTFIITYQSQHPQVWSSSAKERQAFLDWQEEYLQDYQQNREQWIEKLSECLNRLSHILHIDDIISSLPSNCDQIILIPHRFLHLIPLHALPLSEGDCLLDRFPRGVRYAPSCQLLQLTQNQARTNFERFLAIQNPTKDLGYTTVEVGTIQHYFSHADVFVENAAQKATLVQVKTKDDGTREVIQNSQLSLANCAHFSCHSEFNFKSPLDSALLLADGERLTLGEIFDLDLSQCRLVTLSACETGLTNYKILSDEYVGIPSSFLYAGSPSIVSSLWTVQDVSTAFLIIKFYQNLSLSETVAIALNQAQLWLRNLTKKELQEWISENQISLDATLNMSLRRRLHKMSDNEQPFNSPFHWAAFCAIGQ